MRIRLTQLGAFALAISFCVHAQIVSGNVKIAGNASFGAAAQAQSVSYGSGVTTPATTASSMNLTPTGTALTSCQPLTTSGTYYLANDVTCTTQGFAINAANVTLNLNQHTVTYGNASSTVPAVSMCDNYSTLPASACGGTTHASAVIENGTITEASSAAPFSHAVHIGQAANFGAPGTLTNLTINISQAGAQAIHGDYPGNGWKITNNVINDAVSNIQSSGQTPLSARSQLQGYAIYLSNGYGNSNTGDTSGPGDTITGNVINGSPQGGISTTNASSTIAYNTITLSPTYSNDYGVITLVNGAKIDHNTVKGTGRGIDVEASNFAVTNNLIVNGETPNNTEYGGCELSGGVGIRVKQYVAATASPNTADTYYTFSAVSGSSTVSEFTGWTITANSVSVNAGQCEGYGLALTNLTHGVTGTVASNLLSTSGTQANSPLILHGSANPQITWTSNQISGNSLVIEDGNGDMFPSAVLAINAGQTWTQLSGSAPTFGLYDANASAPNSTGSSSGGDPVPITEMISIADTIPSPTVSCYSYANGGVTTANYSHTCSGGH